MKKILCYLFIGLWIPLVAVFNEPSVYYGPAVVTNEKKESIEVIGPLQISDSEIKKINVQGPIYAKGITAGSIHVKGPLKIEDSTVGTLYINGPIDAKNVHFNGDISVSAEGVKFYDSTLRNIMIRPYGNSVQTLYLYGSSVVNGNIVFSSSKGRIVQDPGVQMNGTIEGLE